MKMNNLTPDSEFTYQTPDLYLAAFLIARGCRLKETAMQGSKVFFCLENKGNISGKVTDFFNNELVPIQGFIQNLKALRSLCKNASPKKGYIYNENKNGN
jgi:hypothetical protein